MLTNTRDLLHVETDNNNNLIINFSQYLGYGCKVKITSWKDGISWTDVTEAGIQTIADIHELGVPFVCICKADSAAPWLATFPDGLQEKLVEYESHYRGTVYALLWCISRSKPARELFETDPLLVWLVLKTAKTKCWDIGYLMNLFTCKRTRILFSCELGESKSILKIIRKLKLLFFCHRDFELIRASNWSNVSKNLSHLPFIDRRLLQLLEHYPNLETSKLIQKFGSGWCWKDFNIKFKDTLNMAADLGHRDIMARINSCKGIPQLTNIHDKLAAEINDKTWEDLPLVEYCKPPINGTSFIVPITNNHDLHWEGREQSHCVASYHSQIFQEEYYVYKILQPERATLGLKATRDGRYLIDQINLKCNAKVNAATLELVMVWFNSAITDYKKISN